MEVTWYTEWSALTVWGRAQVHTLCNLVLDLQTHEFRFTRALCNVFPLKLAASMVTGLHFTGSLKSVQNCNEYFYWVWVCYALSPLLIFSWSRLKRKKTLPNVTWFKNFYMDHLWNEPPSVNIPLYIIFLQHMQYKDAYLDQYYLYMGLSLTLYKELVFAYLTP